jgi:hypothetical protein
MWGNEIEGDYNIERIVLIPVLHECDGSPSWQVKIHGAAIPEGVYESGISFPAELSSEKALMHVFKEINHIVLGIEATHGTLGPKEPEEKKDA